MRRRQYLSGMDWFVRALDQRTRAATGVGNYSQIVLVLKGALDHEALRQKLGAFITANPILAGRCRRNWLNLAPYWSVARSARPEDMRLDVRHLPGGLPVDAILAALSVTKTHPTEGPVRIAFTVVPHGERTYVSMRFDHQILDAIGAERLLMHLSQTGNPAQPIPLGERPAHLNRWGDKFRSGQVVNREVISLRGDRPPAAVPLPVSKGGCRRQTRFVIRAYSARETARIGERADMGTGYLLLLPYLLGLCVRALHAMCCRLGVVEGDYVIPVSVDCRPRGSDSGTVFFNNLSFNFYRFSAASAEAQTALWEQAVKQMYAQVQKRVAYHVANAGMLMRILPASWLGRLMTLPLEGRLGSMSFAFVGKEGYTSEDFMGVPVENAYHMPRVPVPPGLGVFFTQYRDRLTLVCSYLEGMLDESMASRFVNDIDSGLKAED